ncbi:uncharacterized protein [Venturia canescens]|uniref:uncharacterized protein isoform X2 n=1 Tax=Venturia canescens TaxID=32260 RepID=UPI001C9C3B99|nr:uncharacterized protein LOC122407408 isoform X2 [Venturia canescens]
MALLKDIEPLFVGARVFGCTPHRITDRDLLVTKWGYAYSLLLGLIFLYGCIAGIYLISVDIMEEKILLLTAGRTILSYICFFTDALLTMIWNDKLRNSIAHLHDFDVSTKFNQSINIALLYRWRLALAAVVLFWCIVGYASFRCERSWPLFNGICYGIVNAAMSMQVLKFIGFLMLLYQRFGHLEKLILTEGTNENGFAGSNIGSFGHPNPRIQLHDVWWLHCRLSDSAEQINSVYTVQLLFWITTMFLNALSRMYTLTGSDGDMSFLKVRETMSVIACLINLLVITLVCHFTALQGNRVGSTMFCPRSVLMRKRSYVEGQDSFVSICHFCCPSAER